MCLTLTEVYTTLIVESETLRALEISEYMSHNFKLVRATVDGVQKSTRFSCYTLKGSSLLGSFCHGSKIHRWDDGKERLRSQPLLRV